MVLSPQQPKLLSSMYELLHRILHRITMGTNPRQPSELGPWDILSAPRPGGESDLEIEEEARKVAKTDSTV